MIEREGISVVYQFNEVSQDQKTGPSRKSNLSINVKKFEPNSQQTLANDTGGPANSSNRNQLKKTPKLKRDQKENTIGNLQQFQVSSRNKKLDRLNYMSGIDILQAYKLKYKECLNNRLKPNNELKKNCSTGLNLFESQISKSEQLSDYFQKLILLYNKNYFSKQGNESETNSVLLTPLMTNKDSNASQLKENVEANVVSEDSSKKDLNLNIEETINVPDQNEKPDSEVNANVEENLQEKENKVAKVKKIVFV